MQPAQLEAIRQSLEKACRLVKPRRAALEAFTGSLVKLLVQAQGQPDQQQAQARVVAVLPAACLAAGDEPAPANSSPVCYAHIPGLREGFDDASLAEPPANRGAALSQALPAARYALKLMLGAAPAGPAALEKQITALVCQLFELSPEEMTALERS